MRSRRSVLLTLAIIALAARNLPASAASGPIRLLDTDNDGTVDLAEAKKAASALFDRLERDRDGTLDKHELAGRLSAKELAATDPDHDGTLTKELNSAAGKALLRLLR